METTVKLSTCAGCEYYFSRKWGRGQNLFLIFEGTQDMSQISNTALIPPPHRYKRLLTHMPDHAQFDRNHDKAYNLPLCLFSRILRKQSWFVEEHKSQEHHRTETKQNTVTKEQHCKEPGVRWTRPSLRS